MKLRFIINLSCLLFVSTSSIELKAVDDNIPKELSLLLKEPLKIAGNNSKELLRAVSQLSDEKADALVFLIKNMPDRDLKNLTADYLVENVNYAFKARKDSEWASKVPKDIFLNDVLSLLNDLFHSAFPFIITTTTLHISHGYKLANMITLS